MTNCSCGKCARYNYEGERALYCGKCKLEGMVNTKDKRCKCGIRVSYNLSGLTAICCVSCKTEDMIDVRSGVKCSCGKQALYNYKEEPPKFCGNCKLQDMINTRHKMCNCGKFPTFNFGGLKPLFCFDCKKENMVDVRSSKCLCNKVASFNYEGLTPKFCFDCKKSDMVNVKNNKCGCGKIPCYNYEGLSPLYCFNCKKEDMINVIHRVCKTHLCNTQVYNPNYEGYCYRCFIFTFPNKPTVLNYKTKEKYVVDFVLENFKDVSWVLDKKVQNGCSSRRPDMLLDLGYQVIIIEIDENQHINYNSTCENKRIMELSQDNSHRPLVFIRFNPDDYINNNKKISSCWGINKKGICCIRADKEREWIQRLLILKEQIQYWLNPENITEKTIEKIQLFYNC
jgi:hypothetical protein